MTERAYNFSAGPAMLPEPVLKQVQQELLALPGPRASVMEISHRSSTFKEIIGSAEVNIRKLLAIPENYSVLFLQGGGRMQFSMIPMNLLGEASNSADYILTGSWAKHAAKEAAKVGDVLVAWNGKEEGYTRTPDDAEIQGTSGAGYTYFVCNETIEGVQFPAEPAAASGTLVCDASSDLLHRPVDISKYGLIFACAQKNIGPAGVTIVVMRNDLLERSSDELPTYMNYKLQAEAGSLLNTAPTFAVYVVSLVTDWLLSEFGGLDKMYEQNKKKAAMLYDVVDSSSGFYTGHAQPQCRSLMNVTFRLPSDELTKAFVSEAAANNMTALAGHRSVGGVRASIYNAMPMAGVEALRDFMIDFRNKHAN